MLETSTVILFLLTLFLEEAVLSLFLFEFGVDIIVFLLSLLVLVDVEFCLLLFDSVVFCLLTELLKLLLLSFLSIEALFLLFKFSSIFVFFSLLVTVGISKSSLVVVSNELVTVFVLFVFVNDELLSFNSLPECLLQEVGIVPIKKYSSYVLGHQYLLFYQFLHKQLLY